MCIMFVGVYINCIGVVLQLLNLENNHIGKLDKDSFDLYPNIKKLYMAFNKVHTVEPHSLELLTELEILDLSDNAMREVPAGLPKSLHKLYLGANPIEDMSNLANALGLQTLSFRGSDLPGYPSLGVLPNLVELDVSEVSAIVDLDPVKLAGTCRLAKLNVTGTMLFQSGAPDSHCRCRRAEEWLLANKIHVYGMAPCPSPLRDDENCTRVPEDAREVFKKCMAEWEHRNTPYWAIGFGLMIVVAVIMLVFCFCVRRRRRGNRSRRSDKVQTVPPSTDCSKENSNKDSAAAAGNKTEPTALLS